MSLESDVLTIIKSSGLLDAFTDHASRAQPAIDSQILLFDESEFSGRFICVRSQGGTYNHDSYQRPSVAVYIAGLPSKSDAYICSTIADRFNQYFTIKRDYGAVQTIIPTTANPKLMLTDSGRPIYELYFDVIYKNA